MGCIYNPVRNGIGGAEFLNAFRTSNGHVNNRKSLFMKFKLSAILLLFASGAKADVTFKYISAGETKVMADSAHPNPNPNYIADGPDFRLSFAERKKPGKVE